MLNTLIYDAGTTDACKYASRLLKQLGFPLTDHPAPEVTHLLLDCPSFRPDGRLKSGDDAEHLLSMLPQTVTVVGGNLAQPALISCKTLDFLKDPYYLAKNAAITADCALKIAAPLIKTVFADTPTLILGWGRIGKYLAHLLKALHCPVTIGARKASDLAMIQALGYDILKIQNGHHDLSHFRLLFNTIPASVLDTASFCSSCVKIELASVTGINSHDTVIARGLPGTYAPESSGRLIAETFYRLWKEQSQ